MEIIKAYLENMFMNLPDTPEVSRAKPELLSMMEDKYNELKSEGKNENEAVGIVISEFGNLEELASSLGLESYVAGSVSPDCRRVNTDEANHYIALCKKSGIRTGIGVMLCILCSIPVIILGALTETMPSMENIFAAAGVILLLIIIAAAVAIFIINNSLTGALRYIEKEHIELDFRTRQSIGQAQAESRTKRTVYVTIDVMLYIISAIPILSLALLQFVDAFTGALSVAATLFLVSIATFLCIRASYEKDSYQALLEEGKFADKSAKIRIERIKSIYWKSIVCIYLAYSFLSSDWRRSWIIWPVAGVFSGVITTVYRYRTANSKGTAH